MAEIWIAGVDEAGRGPLAGPVVAAAVVFAPDRIPEGLADSKRLSPARREALFDCIRDAARSHAIAQASVEEIDRLNILQATMLAMQRAVASLAVRPCLVRVDGNRAPELGETAVETLVGGDAVDPAISAASILAKVHRDRLMQQLDLAHPGYGLDRHKGYATREHLAALERLGPSAVHRRSFRPVRQQTLPGLESPGY